MAVQTEAINSQYKVTLDQWSLKTASSQVKQFARDTWKELDQTRKQKLELDVSRAKINLESWKRELKSAKDLNTKQKLFIDTNEAQSNLTEAKKRLQDFRNTGDSGLSRLQSKFDGIGSSIVSNFINPITLWIAAITWLGAAFVSAVSSFRDFDKIQRQLQSIAMASWSTAEEVKLLEVNAKELWKTTKFTAAEVSSLQLELTKLWFSSKEILQLTESTLNLAAAFWQDLWESAKTVGATLKIFWLDVKESARVNDVLASAFANSALDLEKFQTAIVDAWPVAKTFWFSLEEVTSLLGTLTSAGFDASKAGTATRNILLNLADWSGKLAQALWWPVETLPELVAWLKKLKSEWVDLATTLELTDKRSVAAFNTFLDGTDSITKLNDALSNAWWTAQMLAEEQLKGLDWALTLFGSAVDWLAVWLWEFLAPAIIATANWMTGLTEAMFGWDEIADDYKERASQITTEMEALNIAFQNWTITIDEYTQWVADLQSEQEGIITTSEALKEQQDAISEQNEWLIEKNNELSKTSVTLAEQIEVLTAKYWENNKRVVKMKWTLEGVRAEFNANKQTVEENNQVLEFLSWSLWQVNGALSKISTAKSRSEFNKARADAVALIRVFAKIGIAQLKLARVSWDETQIARAKEWLDTVKNSLQAVKDLTFVQTDLNKWVVVNNNSLWEWLKLIKETNKEKTKDNWGWWGGGGWSRVSAAKKQADEIIKQEQKIADESAKINKKIIADAEKDRLKEIADIKKAKDKLSSEDEKILSNFAKVVERSYNDAQKQIEKTEKEIDKLNEKIADTQSKIIELELDAGEWIATRIVEIEAELNTEDLDTEKRIELEKELALALANTTEEERARAELLASENETEKIIRETAEKKMELENQIKDLETQKEAEQIILQKSIDDKLVAEKGYTAAFWIEIKKRTDMQIAEAARLAQALSRSRSENWIINNTTNTNWPVSVSVNAQTNASPTMIADAVSKVIVSARWWNSL